MTFSARFEIVHLSDFLSFLGVLMKGDGGDGDIKGNVKGAKGGCGGQKKRRGHH